MLYCRSIPISVTVLRQNFYFLITLLFRTLGSALAQRATTPEEKTAKYFESVPHQHSLLQDFLQRMPKGGDLHNHLSGAVYAESFVRWAVQDGLCVDRTSSSLVPP